jgi:16S rRNA (cytidine1402-2'-O)-methyltransferase
MNQSFRSLYLIPSLLAPGTKDSVLPPDVLKLVNELEFFFAEDVRTARRFLSEVGVSRKIEELKFYKLDKETTIQEVKAQLKEIPEDKSIGIISEAGCPCIADPGALLVSFAHEQNWNVLPLVGPSSILLALIASGFNGQEFTFLGYLPIEKEKRGKAIKEMEKEAVVKKRTQIFMETPYRNNALMDDLIKICGSDTKLCVASNITGQNQFIKTQKIKDWRINNIDLNKQPSIFILSGS